MAETNDTRHAQMTVDLGGEQVLLKRARCSEVLGGSFDLEVDIVATLGEVNLLPHLGQPIAVHVQQDFEPTRHFHGLIVGGEFVHEQAGRHSYHLYAKPFTHFLSHNRDMAIFQNINVPNIIQRVIEAAGFSDFRFLLRRAYPTRDYCVQYRESDLTFITRLMEEEGIYYFWEHSADRHEMVLCDEPGAHLSGHPDTLRFNPLDNGADWGVGADVLSRFGERVATGGESEVTLRAFDFRNPERPVQAQTTVDNNHAGPEREVYSYPGAFLTESRGEDLTNQQLLALRSSRQIYSGRTQAMGLACGTNMSVTQHPTSRLNARYLITHTVHVIENEQYRSGEQGIGDDHEAEGSHVVFSAIPAATHFYLVEATPKPVVQGLESAIVTGPDGEEIYTDRFGRVKVRFHWDRSKAPSGAPPAGETTTCWIRVAQFGGLGDVTLPRVGQEVMVDFLHGNPDEPIVMGWVFNTSQMPVYELPKHRSRHVLRGRSYPGGMSTQHPGAARLDTGTPGANEIRLEDAAGSEEIFIHSEKDLNVRVRNDNTHHVARNQIEKVYWNRDAFVGNDEITTVHNHQNLKIEEGNQTEKIEKGNREVTIAMGNDTNTVEMGNLTTGVKMGDISIKADLGKIDIEAMQSITLKVGGSSITIDQLGVKIEGTVTVKIKGVMVESAAGAMHTIKGGLVMIN